MDIDSLIEQCMACEEWKQARELILRELKKTPESHWLLARLGMTYYEERKYKKALEIEKRALKLAPRCPLVLWDYACTLDMLNNKVEAIRIWRSLLRRGEESIAYDECGEGIRWARSLLNDCKYRIALSYRDMGNKTMAIRYLKEHIASRSPGIPSLYSLAEVKKELANLSGEKIPQTSSTPGAAKSRMRGKGQTSLPTTSTA